MDFEVTPEQAMIRDLCRDFAKREIAPYADEWFEAEHFPTDVFKELARLDLMGLLIPEEYGGSDAGTMGYGHGDRRIGKN